MKTKFIFVFAETFDAVPNAEKIQQHLKCESVIDLSLSIDELAEVANKSRYYAGPLQSIYTSICSRYSSYFLGAWNLDPKKYYTRKLMNVFLVSDDSEIKNLLWATLKGDFQYRAFTLEDDGIDPIMTWIGNHQYLDQEFKVRYDEYRERRDKALHILSGDTPDADKTFYDGIQKREQDLLVRCEKEAIKYLEKVREAMISGWD
jgi:hypothetical protein